jgi:hypothetical protein
MRPLSYREFASLVGYITLPPQSYRKLLVFTVLPYMANPPKMTNLQTIDQTLLVEEFFPCHANSASPVENAKMSFVLERLLLQLLREGRLSSDGEILMQISKGVAARNKRINSDGRRRKTTDVLDDARDELKLSGERMLLYMRMIPGISCPSSWLGGANLSDVIREHVGASSPSLSSLHTQSELSFG